MRGELDTARREPNVGVLLEQSLGHVTHGDNLRRVFQQNGLANVECRDLPFEPRSLLDRIPPRSNWTVRSGLAARKAVNDIERHQALDALIVHTQVPAMLLSKTMERVPTIVSLDATPKQIDELGSSYQHRVGPSAVERLKWNVHHRCFDRAERLVTWSQWAADSLTDDYGVNRHRIEVIPPGAVASRWRRPEPRRIDDSTVRVLFVGGDFDRKGGQKLLDSIAALRNDSEMIRRGMSVEVHVVTKASVARQPGVHVHNNMTPNSPELVALFHLCDLFALPTEGDCTPLVLAEAATAGLPTVTTDVGAINESVINGTTGLLVDPTVDGVTGALRTLILDHDLRHRMSTEATRHAAETMDADRNATRLLETALALVEPKRPPRVLLTVSGTIDSNIEDDIESDRRPLADYMAISRATGAELLDWEALQIEGSRLSRLVQRLAGANVAMAYHLWRQRNNYDVIISDGEQVGIPFAAFSRLARHRDHRHVVIGHRLSAAKKKVLIRFLGLSSAIDRVLVYSSSQQTVAEQLFGDKVRLTDFMVDSDFFQADQQPLSDHSQRRPLLCAAGRESRDYPVLIEAVRDLDVDLVIASASPWSRRKDNAHDVDLSDNVTVTAMSQIELRALLNRADAVIVPLKPTDFQAGVTTILEAMSMGRPVVCTATEGQTDVVEDGVNGLYVPVDDPAAMRQTIEMLFSDHDSAINMGKLGRELVETRADVRIYANMFADIVTSLTGHTPDVVDPDGWDSNAVKFLNTEVVDAPHAGTTPCA